MASRLIRTFFGTIRLRVSKTSTNKKRGQERAKLLSITVVKMGINFFVFGGGGGWGRCLGRNSAQSLCSDVSSYNALDMEDPCRDRNSQWIPERAHFLEGVHAQLTYKRDLQLKSNKHGTDRCIKLMIFLKCGLLDERST